MSGSTTPPQTLATSGTIATQYPNLPPTTKFTQSLAQMFTGDIPVDNPARTQLIAAYQSYIGQPISAIPFYTGTFSTPTGGLQNLWGGQNNTQGFQTPFNFDITRAVMFIGVILVGITLLLVGGIVTLRRKNA